VTDLRIVATRGDIDESAHRVSVAVVRGGGAVGRWGGGLLASAGDPELVTFWRSAAKPFQALPLVEDGARERFGLESEELALACASHSSEQVHLRLRAPHPARSRGRGSRVAGGAHRDAEVEQLQWEAQRDARARQAPWVGDERV
jgi:L-asparaginase II